jgi:hypothetical protein
MIAIPSCSTNELCCECSPAEQLHVNPANTIEVSLKEKLFSGQVMEKHFLDIVLSLQGHCVWLRSPTSL